MPQEVMAKAFEPFFTTKEVGTGSGLGLSQVLGFVRQLRGHVTIESALDRGSVVTLFLPQA
jgi:two-component system NtrC family sensor kinase